MKFNIILLLFVALIGCSSVYGKAQLPAGGSTPVAERTGEPGTYDERIVTGLPVWPGIRLGGLHSTRSHEEIRNDLSIEPPPPPEPEDVLKRWMTRVAVITAICGFFGMLISAFLAYKGLEAWDDVGVIALIAFSGGSLIAWKYTMVMWVSGGAAVGFVLYLVYNALKKEKRKKEKVALEADKAKLEKAKDSLVDSLDFVKKISTWDDKAKILLDSKLQDLDVREVITDAKKGRALERTVAIEEAVKEWEAAPTI